MAMPILPQILDARFQSPESARVSEHGDNAFFLCGGERVEMIQPNVAIVNVAQEGLQLAVSAASSIGRETGGRFRWCIAAA